MTLLLLGHVCIHGMIRDLPSLSNASMKAGMGYGTDWLEQIIYYGDCNEQDESTGYTALHEAIRHRCPLPVLTAGLQRADMQKLATVPDTFFRFIARCPAESMPKEQGYSQASLMLASFAVPAYQEKSFMVDNRESSCERIKTFLCCLERNEVKCLKPVKWAILAHLLEDLYCFGLFTKVVDHIKPETLCTRVPFAWFSRLAQRHTGDDRDRFVQEYAPLFARRRLAQVERIMYPICVIYTMSKLVVEELEGNNRNPAVIADARRMVDLLNPEGFIERNMPACTHIITNMLIGKEPLDGVTELYIDRA